MRLWCVESSGEHASVEPLWSGCLCVPEKVLCGEIGEMSEGGRCSRLNLISAVDADDCRSAICVRFRAPIFYDLHLASSRLMCVMLPVML